ncbi:MAG TPA: sigma-70 family RNA polymerase sigma factor [Kofleriaceae bacterium]|nr:sigma-70 family RNA polymerase sigma factor [Kofleriaceae bacterium]
MRERSDAELVVAAAGGDQRAFELLIRRHIERLRQLLAGLLPPDLVDDLAQTACMTAWERLATIEQPDAFGSWLCGIGLRLAWQELRSKRKRPTHNAVSLDVELDHLDAVEEAHTPYSELAGRIRHDRLVRAIRALPARNAEVVWMYHLEQRSCREIAGRLGMPIATVHKRLSRGRDMLEKALAPLRGQLAAVGGLGAGASATRGAPASTDPIVAATMRAVRRHSRPIARLGRVAAAVAALVARLVPRWRAALVATAAVVLLLAPAVGLAVALVRTVHDLVATPAGEPSPGRARAAAPAAPPPPAPRLPAPPPADRDEPEAPEMLAARAPDYLVSSASTDPGAALFGAHDLRPMDAYGQQLYEAVSKAFVMHFGLCLRKDVVGEADRSRIVVDLRFTLWRDPGRAAFMRGNLVVADQRDVTYRLEGRPLSGLEKFQFERCIEQAFENTEYPLAGDGAPREILHHIAVDFGAIQDALDALFASVP